MVCFCQRKSIILTYLIDIEHLQMTEITGRNLSFHMTVAYKV